MPPRNGITWGQSLASHRQMGLPISAPAPESNREFPHGRQRGQSEGNAVFRGESLDVRASADIGAKWHGMLGAWGTTGPTEPTIPHESLSMVHRTGLAAFWASGQSGPGAQESRVFW
ncbi:hypothetical protein LIA77_11340 [Sarocladium implicatum]|nr:hypothetical protein LIA77_11340 [Sarocladium implicatum]